MKLGTFDPTLLGAILTGQVARSISREQVDMTLGDPMTIENPAYNAPAWHDWIADGSPFDADQHVDKVSGDSWVQAQVYAP